MQADDLRGGQKYLVSGATLRGEHVPAATMEYSQREAFMLEFRLADGRYVYVDVDELRSGLAKIKPAPADPDRAA